MAVSNTATENTTRPYTVVGFYSDNLQSFVHHVDAGSATDAKQKLKRGLTVTPMIAAVFPGHLQAVDDDLDR